MSRAGRETLMHEVITLTRAKMSRRAIARTLGISRNTVRALLAEHEAKRVEPSSALPVQAKRAARASKLDGFKSRLAELLKRYPDITAQRVYETLHEEGFKGGYTAVKRYVRAQRPPARPTPSLRTPDYGPGEMAENDWSPYEVAFTHAPPATVQGFSYVLVHSRRKYYGFYESNDLFALMDGHVRAFARFGGCAATCKYDSQKPVVLRWEGRQPIYNPRFLAFATHYNFRPFAVRRRHPNDKPRVERSFWELERSFFNGREFRDFQDLCVQLERWHDQILDRRRLKKQTALERFALEKPLLTPLPRHAYDTARVVYRVCSIDGFVAWRGNRYAVPYAFVTDILVVRITQRELFVYGADLSCIAHHELGPRGAGLDIDPSEVHPRPNRRNAVDLDQVRHTFEGMGEGAAEFIRQMSQGPARTWGVQARQILQLRERYDTEDLDHALAHAAVYGALTRDAVERILDAKAKPRSLDEYVVEDTARRLEQVLGECRTEPRDLTEYDRLPLATRQPEQPWPLDDADPATLKKNSSDSEDTCDSSD